MATKRALCAQVLAAGLLFTACTEAPPRMVVDPELEAIEADYIIFGLTDYLTRRGVREAVVEADTALVFQDSTVVLLRGNVKLTAYNEELGTEKAIVTSDRGQTGYELERIAGGRQRGPAYPSGWPENRELRVALHARYRRHPKRLRHCDVRRGRRGGGNELQLRPGL